MRLFRAFLFFYKSIFWLFLFLNIVWWIFGFPIWGTGMIAVVLSFLIREYFYNKIHIFYYNLGVNMRLFYSLSILANYVLLIVILSILLFLSSELNKFLNVIMNI